MKGKPTIFDLTPASNRRCLRAGRATLRPLFAAGEIGHICVDPERPICRCGQRGCLEAVYGAAGIERAATAAAKAGASPLLRRILKEKGTISSIDVSRAAREGDGYANAIVQEMGLKLGTVLAGFVDLLNPEKLLIGGGLSNMDPRLLAGIQQGIYGRSMPLMTRSLIVERPCPYGRQDEDLKRAA